MATHLKFKAGLDMSNIAVISGGVSGLQSLGGIQNFPDSVFDCAAIDVIGIHGRFAASEDEGKTAGTAWAEMLVPGNTLTSRALGKKGKGKLLLVEEWEYVHTDAGIQHKKEAVFDQGNALNLRGIPWVRSPPSLLPGDRHIVKACADENRSIRTCQVRTSPQHP